MHNTQLWTADFAANLYDTADWFRIGKDLSSYVKGSIVHVPNAAANTVPVAIDGTTVYPVPAVKVTYADLTFTNKMIATSPRFVTNIDSAEASFDTRSAEMAEIVGSVKQAISAEVAYGWAPAAASTASIILSTGAARTNVYGNAAAKALTFANILAARTRMARNKANMSALYLIVDPVQMSDLLLMPEFSAADELATKVAVDGYIGQVAGMKVIQRTLGVAYTGAVAKPLVVDYEDVYTTTHKSAALVVDASKVGYAVGTMENGEIHMGITPYATGYYADVLQGHTRVGASALYLADAAGFVKGTVAIVEG